jgi:KDO2-lipid IV(A) lauroyltransferase
VKRNKTRRRLDRLAGRYFMIFALKMIKWLPDGFLFCFSRFMGHLGYWAVAKYRRVAANNLKESFPEKSRQEIKKIAVESYCEVTWGAVEIVKLALNKNPKKKLLELVDEIEGLEYLDKAFSLKKGVICISAHLGNFTIMTRRLELEGYPFNLIMRFADDEVVTELWQRVMRPVGIKAISARPRRKAVIEALKWLRANKGICLYSDQNKTNGIYVDFFGRPAGTVEGPGRMHLRTKAPMLCAFIIRKNRYRHKIVIRPLLDIKLSGNDEEDMYNITQAFTHEIEEVIRQHPQLWWWMHDRWKGLRRLKSKTS